MCRPVAYNEKRKILKRTPKYRDVENARRRERYHDDVEYRKAVNIRARNNHKKHPEWHIKACKTYLEKHPDRRISACKTYLEKYPERRKATLNRRRAHKLGNGGTHTGQDINDLIRAQEYRCFYCNKLLFSSLDPCTRHVEHVIAISNGGSNDPYNLVYACQKCNYTKRGLFDCADALLLELIKDGTLSGTQAFHKSFVLKTARERQTNPILFEYRLRYALNQRDLLH